ncbi:MAG: PQQ-binding-like beta-propeller repeat protein [Planctomycetota bacterium]|nr:PQQ-binding-like beta-propeller repeat protein [Planctomycetota bacterium]
MICRVTHPVQLFFSMLVGLLVTSTAMAQQAGELAGQFQSTLDQRRGLCIYMGDTDVTVPLLLCDGGKHIVNILTPEMDGLDEIRARIAKQQLLGMVSAEQVAPGHFPHSTNLVNLVVIDQLADHLAAGLDLREVVRVLAPGGVAWIGQSEPARKLNASTLNQQLEKSGIEDATIVKNNGLWARIIKPRPKTMDTWTHNKYDATSNPVSRDQQIGIPRGVRWVAGPNWPTGHRKQSVPTVVASRQRLVYVFQDEVMVNGKLTRQDSLIARDAFNGLPLWRRKGTTTVLISVGDRVYVTDSGRQLVALDADTGIQLEEFSVAPGMLIHQLLHVDGMLVVGTEKGVAVLDANSGKTLWSKELSIKDHRQLVVGTVAGKKHVFCHDDLSRRGEGSFLVALSLADGTTIFRKSISQWAKGSPDLVLVQDNILVVAGDKGNHGVSAVDGQHLWDYSYSLIGHGGSYKKVLSMNGLFWIHTADTQKSGQYAWEGLHPQTGKVEKRVIQPSDFSMKHRCSVDVATTRYFMGGSMDFADLVTGDYEHFEAARNSCAQASMLPANGLLYTFPHACGCYPMLRGFLGLTSNSVAAVEKELPVLQRGPAFDTSSSLAVTSDDWPTYRHDTRRTGASLQAGPGNLEEVWTIQLAPGNNDPTSNTESSLALSDEWTHRVGGRLSAPVVAGGIVFIAVPDQQQLRALDAGSGKPAWTFSAGGRIDCPPTIEQGRCLLGSRDGWVYCLDASSGQLAWRRRAAPSDRRIVAYGQLESPWPVVGGVLAMNGMAFFDVGRHASADGGLTVQAVDLITGALAWSVQPAGFSGVPDILTGDGEQIQMASWQFDTETGKNSSSSSTLLRGGRLGLLNDAWYQRPIAIRKGLQGWTSSDRPSGQILSMTPTATFGFTSPKVNGGNGELTEEGKLFHVPLKSEGKEWSITMATEARPRAMVVAGNRVYVAGRLETESSHELLRIYAAEDGQQLDEIQIPASVVHDGMAVARGRLYISLENGQLLCLGTK